MVLNADPILFAAVRIELAEACLAHTVGNVVVQAYQRSSMLERLRPIIAAWASHVTGADADNVPSIGKGEGVFAPRKPVYQGRPSGSFDIVAVSARRGSLVLIAVAGERLTTRDMTPTLTKEPAD